jgi:hypothetical protein
MTVETLTRTACGLYVIPNEHPRLWPNFTWTQDVADMPGNQEDWDALAFIQAELRTAIGRRKATEADVLPIDVAFAALHPCDMDRVDDPQLSHADPEVAGELVDRDGLYSAEPFTVCGVLEDSWRPVTFYAEASMPLVAYFRAWEWGMSEHGEHMLLAAVHKDWWPPVELFGYADPWTTDAASMRAKARDEWFVPDSR